MKTMTLPHPVEEAKKHTTTLDIPETAAELTQRKTELAASFGEALPVEMGNQQSVSAEIGTLDQKIQWRTITERFPNSRIFLPQEPLGWRDDGMPVLAPFGLDSPDCLFVHNKETGPVSVRKFYSDVSRKLRRKSAVVFHPLVAVALFVCLCIIEVFGISSFDPSKVESFFFGMTGLFVNSMVAVLYFALGKGGLHYQAQAVFKGLIPKPARAVIKQAKECGLFKEIFLLAEVPKWEISVALRPVSSWLDDPLIIAFDGEKHWLLDSFNVTPVEMMAAGYTGEPKS